MSKRGRDQACLTKALAVSAICALPMGIADAHQFSTNRLFGGIEHSGRNCVITGLSYPSLGGASHNLLRACGGVEAHRGVES
jgi:hypothetical protein